jgi:uncharacterized protein YqjF (DUF2071 family)
MDDPLIQQDHRPWPLARGPWIMAQVWHDLLFAHWPFAPEVIRSLVPLALELDTFKGQAWLGVVPFRMSGVRLRGTPALPYLSAFPELNVRTYVTHGNRPGVWFFSLDAANFAAVMGARLWFHLPYFHANMKLVEKDGWISYSSQRIHRGAPEAAFKAKYRATGKVFEADRGTLDHWLTERYCLYANFSRRIYRSEIHHRPWQLQTAESEIAMNSMTAPLNVVLPHIPPLLHFAKFQDVRVWAPVRACTV